MNARIARQMCYVTLWCLLSVLSAAAQDTKPLHLYVGGGLSVAGSSLNSAYDTGFHGMMGLGINILPRLQIMPRIEFNAYKIDNRYWLHYYQLRDPAIDTVTGGTLVTLLTGIDMQYHLLSPSHNIRPFISAGGGWANISNADFQLSWAFRTRPTGVDSRNKAYWDIGSGIEFGRGTSFTFFLQARYVGISTKAQRYNSVPLTIGLRF